MSVSVQPTSLQFPKTGGNAELVVTNGGHTRKAIMIRATNFIYLIVSPYYAIIEAGGKTKISVTRNPGSTQTDEVLIAYNSAPDGATSAEKVFENRKEADGELAVQVKIAK